MVLTNREMDGLGVLCLMIDANSNRFEGRTRLQKTAYFAQYLGWDMGRYQFHYYGPFSYDVGRELGMGTSCNIVSETEGTPVVFSLTEFGRKFLRECRETYPDKDRIRKTLTLLKYLSSWSKEDLELAASIDYLRDRNPSLSNRDLLDKTAAIKDNFPRSSVDDAHRKLKLLKRKISAVSRQG